MKSAASVSRRRAAVRGRSQHDGPGVRPRPVVACEAVDQDMPPAAASPTSAMIQMTITMAILTMAMIEMILPSR